MPATAAELTRLSHVLACAFATDPVSDWLFDGDQDTRHPAFFHAFLHHAYQTGRVEQTLDGTGVAVWFDNTTPADPIVDLAFTDRVRDTVGHPGRWHALDTAMRAAHPTEPHWWLVFLGVLPAHQHRGYGHLLLHHATTWQDGPPRLPGSHQPQAGRLLPATRLPPHRADHRRARVPGCTRCTGPRGRHDPAIAAARRSTGSGSPCGSTGPTAPTTCSGGAATGTPRGGWPAAPAPTGRPARRHRTPGPS